MKEKNIKPLIDEDGEVSELTAEDLAQFRPAREVLPPELFAKLTQRQGRGPARSPTKKQVSVRLDSDLLEALKAGGKGWQTRMNDTLRTVILKK